MSPEQRAAFLDAVSRDGSRNGAAVWMDYLVEYGAIITHPSVRDHTDCETCGGEGYICEKCGDNRPGCANDLVPCPAGRLVPWEPEGEQI